MLGCIAKTSIGSLLSKELGATVINALKDSSGWVAAEACDIIFSVFDDNFDDIVESLNMLPALRDFGINLEKQIQTAEIKSDKALYFKLDEVLTNIVPFLEYKTQQKK
eukprot:TRINITY_DN6829_c0_g3_i7.p1 TRINITY_DN6829_c0_g3~~TRINITY_DN6829_c0_g3_i7.p1  ORF type:complete len:108 (+),score=27.87 TRINITY_DN6829_c0_g3_i7:133-456(+)